MRTREVWKRVLAWMLTAAMVVGSSSFAAADEEISDLSAQEETVMAETEVSGEETDVPYTDMVTPATEPDIFVPSDEELPDEEFLEEEQDALVVADEQDQAGELQSEDEETTTESSMAEISVDNVEIVDHGIETVDEKSGEDDTVPVPTEIAGELKDGSDVEVILENEGDCKWYTFTAEENGVYEVYASNYSGDPRLELYIEREKGDLTYIDEFSWWVYSSSLRFSCKANVTYYFKIFSWQDSDSYSVHVKKIVSQNVLEFGKHVSFGNNGETVAVDFVPNESGEYMFAVDEPDVEVSVKVFDYENSEKVSGKATDNGYRVKLAKGRKYIITVFPYDEDPFTLYVRPVKKIESISFKEIKTYTVLTENEIETDLGLFVNYTDTEPEEFSGFWYPDKNPTGKRIFYNTTYEGDRIEITLWDGEQQIDMFGYDNVIASGTYTLKVSSGGQVYDQKSITINPVSASKLNLNGEPSLGVNDGEGNAYFTFVPAKTSVYVLRGGSNDKGENITVRLYEGENNLKSLYNYYCDDQEFNWVFSNVLKAGKTYNYVVSTNCPESSVEMSITEPKIETLEDGILKSVTGEDGNDEAWLWFVPQKTAAYRLSMLNTETDAEIYDDGGNQLKGYWTYEEEDSFYALEKGRTYLLHLYSGSEFTVKLSAEKAVESIRTEENGDLFFENEAVNMENLVWVAFDDESTESCLLENESHRGVFGYYVRSRLYETDASGNPNYDKPLGDTEYYDGFNYYLKAGLYAWVIEIGILDTDYNFTRLNDIAPSILKIHMTGQSPCRTHKYETVTVKAATCATAGSTVKRCTECGYEDPSSVKSIPPTGKHTGGKATCTKKAVCSVCGQEYGALAAHSFGAWKKTSEATVFKKAVQTRSCSVCGKKETQEVGNTAAKIIKLNASSLKMKVKQKTTKLTVTMGPGDSISSVKSSNTKVLKATVKGGKITLTAQKKTGTAKLTIKLASGASKTIKVTVQKKAVTTKSIKGVSKKLTLKKKKKTTLKPELNPITSQDKIKYSSSNKKVATVNSNGVVTAKKAGKAIITIKAGKKSFKCTITVK